MKLPQISGVEFVKKLQRHGFVLVGREART